MPAYVIVVPRTLSLEAPLGAECDEALALLEAIEQRADPGRRRGGLADGARAHSEAGDRGTDRRRALRHGGDSRPGPAAATASMPGDVAWVLESAPSEVLVLRPGQAASAPSAI